MNFPHVATIQRMQSSGTKFVYSSIGSTKCFLQPIDVESASLYGVTWSKGSTVFLPITSDVKEADRLIIDGVTYGVRGTKSHNYGSLKHMRAVLEQI